MKASYAVAALTAGASAGSVHHRHAHLHGLEKKSVDNSTCGCTTIYSTFYGEPTLIFPSAPPAPVTSSSAAPTTTQVVVPVVPTPVPQVCPTTGVYTFPATTITLTESTTVCGATSTALPSGTHTIGGVTTAVTTATTLTLPVPTVSTSEGVTTSILTTTTYVCPEAGTYTIAPTTTTVPKDTTVNYPIVTSFPPGTYTQPEVVTTVTETSYTVYCPFDVPEATPSTTEIPIVTSSVVATAVPTPSTEAPATSYPAPSTASSVSSSASSSASSTAIVPKPTGGLADSLPGKPAALTYTPYLPDVGGGCKTAQEVDSDIAAIAAAGITHVRLYSTDCDTLPNVSAAAEKYGVRLYVGIFIKGDGCSASTSSIKEQVDAIKEWAKYDLVDIIFVGNEAGFQGYCSGAQLASLITAVRGEIPYSGPFSTADTVNTWENTEFSGPVCGVIDTVGCNSHPYFNEATAPSEAGEFVSSQLDICNSICSGKDAFVTETGWPSAGEAHGLAVPGVAEQKIAIDSMLALLPEKVTLLSLTNDLWKGPGEDAWGCANVLGIKLSTS
ncbi:glycoside hydrolase superfamily [Biscogniauxia marginata]|nr:glycoside hydrolase superfamily [Biscogniauxia marginata]